MPLPHFDGVVLCPVPMGPCPPPSQEQALLTLLTPNCNSCPFPLEFYTPNLSTGL